MNIIDCGICFLEPRAQAAQTRSLLSTLVGFVSNMEVPEDPNPSIDFQKQKNQPLFSATLLLEFIPDMTFASVQCMSRRVSILTAKGKQEA